MPQHHSKHLLLSHPCMLEHGIDLHPENAGRLRAILAALEQSPYKKFLDVSMTRMATVEELSAVHDLSYINHVLSLDGKLASIDHETFITKGSVKAARVAAGLGLELVEEVCSGKIENGFALVRPPGHHCVPEGGMGFCIFNNIAIGAKKALAMGVKRVLIVDWDVHHGNGTQKAFYDEPRVFSIDLHQDNLFPVGSGLLQQTGSGKGLGFTANIPLPDSCRDDDYLYAFEKIVKPLARMYRPELILVSAGFDAHESDPLGSMSLTTSGFGKMCGVVKSLAKELCGGKMVLFLEGGYNPPYLAANVIECVRVLVDEAPATVQEDVQPYSYGMQTYIQEVYDYHVKSRLT